MLARIEDEMLDSGPRAAGRERLCIVARQTRPLSELIRFVVAPDGRVVADLKRKLPGRGAWVAARRDAVAQAVRRGAFKRAFRGDVVVPHDLATVTEGQLERAVLDALAIARKAGQVAAGYAKAASALAAGAAVGLIHAREAGADGVRKLAAAAKQHANADPPPLIGPFASAELDLALARSNVIHAALLNGQASAAVVARWRALDRFRGGFGERGGEEARATDPGPGL